MYAQTQAAITGEDLDALFLDAVFDSMPVEAHVFSFCFWDGVLEGGQRETSGAEPARKTSAVSSFLSAHVSAEWRRGRWSDVEGVQTSPLAGRHHISTNSGGTGH